MPAHDSKKPVLETWQRDLGEYGDHLAKLDVAMKAVVVQDMQEVLSANRRNQQRVEDELMGGKADGEEDMGDIFIDSPIHHHYPPATTAVPVATAVPSGMSKWIAPALLALGLGAGGIGLGYFLGGRQTSPLDSNYKVLFYDQNGKPIDVPHISTRPK